MLPLLSLRLQNAYDIKLTPIDLFAFIKRLSFRSDLHLKLSL